MGDPVVMSNEQFRALLSSMKEILQVPAANPPADTNTAAVSTNQSSFATCKSRFAGTSEEDVEAFINAITIFKECVNMPDDRALKGLPMQALWINLPACGGKE